MSAHKFCPSWPDRCRGCETYPLTAEYLMHWLQARDDEELTQEEETQLAHYLNERHAS